MPRENNTYTRWRSSDNEDDEEMDEDVEGYLQPSGQPLEFLPDDDDQMQEGRRVLAMATSSTNKKPESLLSSAAMGRVICVGILVCSTCFLLGALATYLSMSSSHSVQSSSVKLSNTSVSSTTSKYPIDDGLISNNSKVPVSNITIICDTTTTTQTTTSSTTPPTTQPSKATTVQPLQTTSQPAMVNPEEDARSMASRLISNLTPDLIRKYIGNITQINSEPHSPIIDYVMATFESLGLKSNKRSFPIKMSFAETSMPNTVEIILKNNITKIVNNATSSMKGQSPYSGFSPNGTAVGPLVYGHFARKEDFDFLKRKGVEVNGSILLIRSGDLHPGIQVRNAELAGAVGVILYPDPADFSGDSPEGKVYPDSMALPLDGVIWQNLQFIPGNPSELNYGISQNRYLGIPSIIVHPVSSESGKTLISLLGGLEAPAEWNGALSKKYYLGGSFKEGEDVMEIRINSTNFIADEHSTNIHALLPAEDTSKVIHVGCRFETKGTSLTSTALGLASLLALAEGLKLTFPNGTKRQVVFSVFEAKDGEFAGGNEYSKLYSSWLETSGIAYIDMDTVIEGAGYLEANVSPLLRDTVRDVLNYVSWPVDEGLNVMQGLLRSTPAEMMFSNNSNTQESFDYHNPFECDEALNYHSIHGIPTIQLKGISANKSASYTLKHSQYDTMEAIINLEDKELKWTHMVASLMGVTAVMLSSLYLPPVRFDEVGYDLKKGWHTFLLEQQSNLNLSNVSLHDIESSISGEIDILILTLESYDSWYKMEKKGNKNETAYQHCRALDDRFSQINQFSRRFLRPRTAPKYGDFGLLLTYGPDPLNPCKGTHYPTVRKALLEAVEGIGPWNRVKEELSYVYSMLSSINTDIIGRDGYIL